MPFGCGSPSEEAKVKQSHIRTDWSVFQQQQQQKDENIADFIYVAEKQRRKL